MESAGTVTNRLHNKSLSISTKEGKSEVLSYAVIDTPSARFDHLFSHGMTRDGTRPARGVEGRKGGEAACYALSNIAAWLGKRIHSGGPTPPENWLQGFYNPYVPRRPPIKASQGV